MTTETPPWSTLGQAITSPAARVADVGHVADAFLALLEVVPWMGRSFGFERALGTSALPDVDLALHLEPSCVPEPGASAPWDALREHPVWARTLALPAQLGPHTEVALEFDASRVHQGRPLPVVFLVRDDLITGPPEPWRAWLTDVQERWLPAARSEPALPEALARGLARVWQTLPDAARIVHVGSLAVRGGDAVRLCVAGPTADALHALLDPLGASPSALGDPDGALAAALASLGDLRFVNLDVLGDRLLPRLGLELHLPGAPTRRGLAPMARRALEALAHRGLVTDEEIAALDRWCGLDDGLARTLTHLKLQLSADAAPRLKAYLKVSPPLAGALRGVRHTVVLSPAAEPTRLHDGFLRQVARTPDAPAVQQGDEVRSYADLDAASVEVARRLVAVGVGHGDRVGIRLPHGPLQAAATLGVLRIGAAYVPVETAWPAARIEAVLGRAQVAATLASGQQVEGGEQQVEGGARVGLDATVWDRSAGEVPAPPDPSVPGDRAYIIYTSGSTGRPKGVVLTHRAAANTLDDVRVHCDVTAADRVLALSSLAFDLSVFDLFGTLAAGGVVVYPEPGEAPLPERAARSLQRDGVTLWNSVPATLGLTLDFLPPRPAIPLRWALLSGDWIPTPLPSKVWERLGPQVRVTSLGGSTEGAVWSILHDIRSDDLQGPSVPYGHPTSMRGQAVRPMRADGRPCAVGEVGELVISGAGVADGYHDDPELTAARFPVDPVTGERVFRTGDYGRIGADGLVQFLGRRDAQVKIQGYRVDLSEVTARLLALPMVCEAAVGVVQSPGLPPRMSAVWVPRPGAEASPTELALALAAHLPAYAVPLAADIRAVSAMPLTANGKVDRGQLFDAPHAPRPPTDDVLAVLREALVQPDLRADDDLFDHGADSLAAAWIAAALEARHGRPVGVVDIYTHPSAEALTAWLATAQEPAGSHDTSPELPLDIDPRGLPSAAPEAPVFLTGATGQLGPEVLDALRRRGRSVVCLVRAHTEAQGRQRVRRALARAGLPTELSGVDVVPGDFARPRFGLSPDAFEALGARVGEILHLGAAVGFFRPRAELERSNVGGTREVLRLAATGALHPVCLVSTAAVHGPLHHEAVAAPETNLADPPPRPLGVVEGSYPWSKWAAEHLAQQGASRGIPVCVVRPSLVLGHRLTGAVPSGDDLLAAALRCSLRVGAIPTLPWAVPVLPNDLVGESIAALAVSSDARGAVHQLAPAHGLRLRDLAAYWRQRGRAVRETRWPVWRALVTTLAASGDRDARLVIRGTSDDLHRLVPPQLRTDAAERQLGELLATSPADLEGLLAPEDAQPPRRPMQGADVYLAGLG